MNGTTPREAVQLAVDYHAFQTAARASDWSGLLAWGPALKRSQKAAGVEMVRTYDIDLLVAHAGRQPRQPTLYELENAA